MNFSIMDIISIVGFVITVIGAIGYKVYKEKTKINISNNNISNNSNSNIVINGDQNINNDAR
nr:MAG TPA: hypothetical protein [Caudoviricetes sp.]